MKMVRHDHIGIDTQRRELDRQLAPPMVDHLSGGVSSHLAFPDVPEEQVSLRGAERNEVEPRR